MMRSIFIGTILGTLGIGGAAVAQEAFTPRPVQGLEMDGATVAPGLMASGPEQRQVTGIPGAANKRGPTGSGSAAPLGKKARITWPEGVPVRVKRMHSQIVEALGLTPQQSKLLQGLMVEKSKAFKARQAAQQGAKAQGVQVGNGPRLMAGKGKGKGEGPKSGKGQRPMPPGR